MKDLNAKEIEKLFTVRQLQAYNSEIRSRLNALELENSRIKKKQEIIIKKEVEIRTKEYVEELSLKDKIISEKDKQIEALKMQIAKM